MRRRAMLAALAVVAGGVAIAIAQDAPPAPPRGPAIGIVANTVGWLPDPLAEQRRARAAGARWLREELYLREVEPRRRGGRWRWDGFDRIVEGAARLRLRVLPLLTGSPRASGTHPYALPEPGVFADFSARVARRYGPGGDFWDARGHLDERLASPWVEIWNEPYFEAFSRGGVDPARYARLFRAAAAAGRAANPHARFLLAAEQSATTADGEHRPWIAPMFAAVPDLAAWVDGVAIHPYSGRSPLRVTPDGRQDVQRVGALVAELARHGVTRAPVWLTEIGWSTCADRRRCVLPASQARYLRELFALLQTHPEWRVRAVFVYHLRDQPGGAPRDREAHFGLLDRRGRPKPAWHALRAVAAPTD